MGVYPGSLAYGQLRPCSPSFSWLRPIWPCADSHRNLLFSIRIRFFSSFHSIFSAFKNLDTMQVITKFRQLLIPRFLAPSDLTMCNRIRFIFNYGMYFFLLHFPCDLSDYRSRLLGSSHQRCLVQQSAISRWNHNGSGQFFNRKGYHIFTEITTRDPFFSTIVIPDTAVLVIIIADEMVSIIMNHACQLLLRYGTKYRTI